MKSHRSDYLILIVLGVVVFAVIVALAAAGWLGDDQRMLFPIRTTESTNVEGVMVYYVLLERLNVSVARSERPLLDDALDDVDVLFLLDPIVPLQGAELSNLEHWVRGGGVLVCSSIPGRLLEGLAASGKDGPRFPCPGGQCPGPVKVKGPVSEGPTDVPAEASVLPLARDVHKVYFKTSEKIEAATTQGASPTAPFQTLFTDGTGPRIGSRRTGRGRVIALADTSFLSSGALAVRDNAILGANLAAYALSEARGRKVAFDEYHLGYGYHQTGWLAMGSLLFRTTPGWSVLSLTSAGILFLFYKGRRFGTRRTPGRPRRRSKLEFVQSVGATYDVAGAHRLAFELNYQWLKRKAAERAGLPGGASTEELAGALSQRTGRPRDHYREILAECEDVVKRRRVSGRYVKAVFTRLAELEREVLNGRGSGQ